MSLSLRETTPGTGELDRLLHPCYNNPLASIKSEEMNNRNKKLPYRKTSFHRVDQRKLACKRLAAKIQAASICAEARSRLQYIYSLEVTSFEKVARAMVIAAEVMRGYRLICETLDLSLNVEEKRP